MSDDRRDEKQQEVREAERRGLNPDSVQATDTNWDEDHINLEPPALEAVQFDAPDREERFGADLEAVQNYQENGVGPYGADMVNLTGGTRPPGHDEPGGNPYNVGTNPKTGESSTPRDPRTTLRDGESPAQAEQQVGEGKPDAE